MCYSEESDGYYQVGIVAWGIGCNQYRVPAAYVNVAGMRRWIDHEMKKRNLEFTYYVEWKIVFFCLLLLFCCCKYSEMVRGGESFLFNWKIKLFQKKKQFFIVWHASNRFFYANNTTSDKYHRLHDEQNINWKWKHRLKVGTSHHISHLIEDYDNFFFFLQMQTVKKINCKQISFERSYYSSTQSSHNLWLNKYLRREMWRDDLDKYSIWWPEMFGLLCYE